MRRIERRKLSSVDVLQAFIERVKAKIFTRKVNIKLGSLGFACVLNESQQSWTACQDKLVCLDPLRTGV